jgi:WD40 repeat protein
MENTQASLVIETPSAVQDLCITESYIATQTVDGTIAILDTQCQHNTLAKGRPTECTHQRFLDVGKNWGIACSGDTMAVAGDDTMVGLWSLVTGYLSICIRNTSSVSNRD